MYTDLHHYTVTEIETILSTLRFQISVLDTVDEEIMAYKVKQSLEAFTGPLFELQLLKENLHFLTSPIQKTEETPFLIDLFSAAFNSLSLLFHKKGLVLVHQNPEFLKKRVRISPATGTLFFQNILHYLYKVCAQSDKLTFEWSQDSRFYKLIVHIPIERLPLKKSLDFELKTAKKLLETAHGKVIPSRKTQPNTPTYLFRCT